MKANLYTHSNCERTGLCGLPQCSQTQATVDLENSTIVIIVPTVFSLESVSASVVLVRARR